MITKKISILSVATALFLIGTIKSVAASDLQKGKEIAFSRTAGNCLACHYIVDEQATMPGTIGPALIGMKARYPNRDDLYNLIYNGVQGTMMPPFGKHQILSKEQIQLITDYIHSL